MVQYFSENLWLAWLLVSLLCLVLELTNDDFFIICFAIGGTAATILAAFCDSFTAQVILFAVVSALSIFFIRPFALKYLHKNKEQRVSNADAIIGRIGRITERIEPNEYGRVKIDGDYWKAQANNNTAIEEGTQVRIVKLESIIVTVEIAE